MCENLKQRMSEGASDTQIAKEWGISKNKLRDLIRDPRNAELKEAFEIGLTAYEAHMESIGINLMIGQLTGKENVWKAFMQHKFKWADKTEVAESNIPVDPMELKARIDEALAKRNKLPRDNVV